MPRSRRRTAAAPVPASVHNAVMAKAQERVDKLEGRLARIIQPLLEQVGEQAAERFTRLATNHLSAAAVNTGVSPMSMMVCVRPRPEEAAAIADPDGDPPDILHVTLVYLGKNDDDQAVADVVEALKPVAAQFAPLEGVVGGYGVFDPAGVGVLLPDVRGLVELRVAVCEALLDAGIDYGRDHGFEAHITVHRDPTDAEQDAALERAAGEPLHFDSIYVVRGNAEEVELPLVGVPALTADAGNPPPPSWTAPFPDELMNVSTFVNLILEKTDPVRKALIEETMTPALKQAGLSFDVTNPLTNATLASTASQVKGIAETTQLNLMQIIRSSYRNGLSIPQTASLIQEGMKAASKTRATMIARTELARGVNGGSLAATQLVSSATGSQYDKRWETAPGAKYPRHEDYIGLDGQTVPLDGAFTVGDDQLQYPGDPDGSPGETINCRCAMTYHTPQGEETATADEPPTLDTTDTAGGGGGAGMLATEDPLTAHLTPLNGTSANGLAISLETRAKAIEPALTAEMKAAADANGAELVGLSHRLKGEASATRKIESDALERNQTVRETAYGVSDMVRYTALYQPDQYVAGARAMLKDLQARGLRVVRFRNTWTPHVPYAGVNIQMAAANGYRFELQFHTPESWALKNGVQHKLYEQWRLLPSGDPMREVLTRDMAANTDALTFPPGVDNFTYDMGGTSVNLGVTPFRPEDDPIGFYNSAKYQQFVDQVGTTANDYGVTVEGLDHMTGVWQGETEPSVAIRAHDHELGLQAFASSLGKSYEQDGVLVFGKGGGDLAARFPAASQEDSLAALAKVGLDGGRITVDGQLEVLGPDTDEFRVQLVKLSDELGQPTLEKGAFSIIENADYQTALDTYAGVPVEVPATTVADTRTVADIIPGAPGRTEMRANETVDYLVGNAAERAGITAAEWRSEAIKSLDKAVADAQVRIRVPTDSLSEILDAGRFKSQFETATSKGTFDNELRAKAEKNMFGYPANLPASERPIYGYLAASVNESGGIGAYGDIIVALKQAVNERTTFSLLDSLAAGRDAELIPTPLSDPGLTGWWGGQDLVKADGSLPEMKIGNYAEAQVHGGVTTNDIAEVIFSLEKEQEAIDGAESLADTYARWAADPELRPASQTESSVKELAAQWREIADQVKAQGDELRARLDQLGIPYRVLESFPGFYGTLK